MNTKKRQQTDLKCALNHIFETNVHAMNVNSALIDFENMYKNC